MSSSSITADVIKASEKVRRAHARYVAAEKKLLNAQRVRDQADADYLSLVKASIGPCAAPATDAAAAQRA